MSIDINDTARVVEYSATAAQTVFTIPFEFYENEDIAVTRNGVALSFASSPADVTEFSVTRNSGTGQGSITLGGGATLNDVILIYSDAPIKRTTNFPLSGIFAIGALNEQLNKLTILIADVARDVARAPLVKMGEQAPSFPLLSVLAGQPITLTGNAEVGYAFAPFSLEPAVGASLAFSDLQGPRSQAVIYNPNGVAEGGYPVEFSAQETTAFVRAYAKVFGGNGTCTITIQDNAGLLLWEKTGVSSSATDEVVSVSLQAGRDLLVVVSEISGTVTGVVAKLEGAIV